MRFLRIYKVFFTLTVQICLPTASKNRDADFPRQRGILCRSFIIQRQVYCGVVLLFLYHIFNIICCLFVCLFMWTGVVIRGPVTPHT